MTTTDQTKCPACASEHHAGCKGNFQTAQGGELCRCGCDYDDQPTNHSGTKEGSNE
jgi:hypothetical protein